MTEKSIRFRSFLLPIVLLAILGGLAFAPFSGGMTRLKRAETRHLRHVTRAIAAKHKVSHLWTFGDAEAADWITQSASLAPGTTVTSGRLGGARKFDGDDKTHIDTRVNWASIPDTFSFTMWLKLKPLPVSQDIIHSPNSSFPTKIILHDGRLICHTGSAEISAAYEKNFDEFTHIALIANAAENLLSLYINGTLCGEAPYTAQKKPHDNIRFGKPVWYVTRHPINGVLDDTAIFDRALTAREVKAFAHQRGEELLWSLAPWGAKTHFQFLHVCEDFLRGLIDAQEIITSLAPEAWRARREIARLPEVRLFMTGEDRRHFIRGHNRSRKSGRRTNSAANKRSVDARVGGRVVPVLLSLDGTDTAYPDTERPSWLLETTGEEKLFGATRVLLSAPERADWVRPLMHWHLQSLQGKNSISNGLCRVSINGRFMGVYIFSDHTHNGVLPGELLQVAAAGRGDSLKSVRLLPWKYVFANYSFPHYSDAAASRILPWSAQEFADIYSAAEKLWTRALLYDPQTPLGRGEFSAILKRLRDEAPSVWRCADASLPRTRRFADALEAYDVIGSNISPYRIAADLELSRLRLPEGLTIEWKAKSEIGEVLTNDGRVIRPEVGGPVGASLTAIVRDNEGNAAEKVLDFRIMPKHDFLPSCAFFINDTISKTRRVDAVAEWYERGCDAPTKLLTATQASGGGIKLRGNSSFRNAKMPFGVAFDSPHEILEKGDPLDSIATINALGESSFVCNTLSYWIFRHFPATQEPNIAPRIRHVEFFINGRYHGLYEVSELVNADLLERTIPAEKREKFASKKEKRLMPPKWAVYRFNSIHPRVPEMLQRNPRSERANFMPQIMELLEIFGDENFESRLPEVEKMVDLANFADMQLLINITKNSNGWPFRTFMMEALVYNTETKRFFNVPWDFDDAFASNSHFPWMQTQGWKLLEEKSPAYNALLIERWETMKNAGFSPEAAEKKARELAAELADYAKWDFRRWRYFNEEKYNIFIEEKVKEIWKNYNHIEEVLRKKQATLSATQN